MDLQAGRSWRPLADTAVAAQHLYDARPDWAAWRRGVDFYPESSLLWLEADTVHAAAETKGKKSLDDFCRSFHGGASGAPAVVTYTFDDLVAELSNGRALRLARVLEEPRRGDRSAGAPRGHRGLGLEADVHERVAGHDPGAPTRPTTRPTSAISIGIVVRGDGEIPDVIPDLPAGKAGVPPGSRLVAVNGRRCRPRGPARRDPRDGFGRDPRASGRERRFLRDLQASTTPAACATPSSSARPARPTSSRPSSRPAPRRKRASDDPLGVKRLLVAFSFSSSLRSRLSPGCRLHELRPGARRGPRRRARVRRHDRGGCPRRPDDSSGLGRRRPLRPRLRACPRSALADRVAAARRLWTSVGVPRPSDPPGGPVPAYRRLPPSGRGGSGRSDARGAARVRRVHGRH